MKFFNSTKPAGAVEVTEIPLGDFPESCLLRVLAQLLPQATSLSQLGPAYGPIMDACRAELSRRWQKRGAPISIVLPTRLPAIAILVGVWAAKIAHSILGDEEAAWRIGGPSLAAMVEEISGAREIIAAVVRVLEESRVALEVPETVAEVSNSASVES